MTTVRLPPSTNPTSSGSPLPWVIKAIILLVLALPIIALLLAAGLFIMIIVIGVALLLWAAGMIRRALSGTTRTNSIPQSDNEGRENVRVIRPD